MREGRVVSMETTPLLNCYADDPRVNALFLAIANAGKDVKDRDDVSVEVPGPPYEYMQSYFVSEIQNILAHEGWVRGGHTGGRQWTFMKSLRGSEDMEVTVEGENDPEERFILTFLLVE